MQQHVLSAIADALEILGEQIAVRRGGVNLAQVEPLRQEIVYEGLEPRRRDQPSRFLSENLWPGQLTLVGKSAQMIIGRSSPQEVRQPRGQLVTIQLRPLLDEEQKLGRTKHGAMRSIDRHFETLAFVQSFLAMA